MRRQGIIILSAIGLILFSFLFTRFFGTFDIRIEKTPTPNQAAVATLADLMLRGTVNSQIATRMANPSTPTPQFATVNGKICYPGDKIPPMTAYFQNTITGRKIEIPIRAGQDSYEIQLPSGKYYAWAWAPQYQIGGMYSKAVACGLKEGCVDHTPLLFDVQSGIGIRGVDICDWGFPLPTESTP
jgi:hypothetical protein